MRILGRFSTFYFRYLGINRIFSKTSKIKVIGLCHEPFHVLQELKNLFSKNNRFIINFDIIGVNHLSYFNNLKINNILISDIYKELLTIKPKHTIQKNNLFLNLDPKLKNIVDKLFSFLIENDFEHKNMSIYNDLYAVGLGFVIYKLIGHFPASRKRHYAEFYPLFMKDSYIIQKKFGVFPTSTSYRRQQRQMYKNEIVKILNSKKVAISKSQRRLVKVLCCLAKNKQEEEIVNIENKNNRDFPFGSILECTSTANFTIGTCTKLNNITTNFINKQIFDYENATASFIEKDIKKLVNVLKENEITSNIKTLNKLATEIFRVNGAYYD
ncbi:hypothetical protein GF354_00345 [Candidatus Peregrinibacteria bacterium]|nr:hypothetical protein [Candidatus Peregrinibacteria bacterium]